MEAVSQPDDWADVDEMRVGGQAGGFEGFTHTWKDVDDLKVEDELTQVTRSCCMTAPNALYFSTSFWVS